MSDAAAELDDAVHASIERSLHAGKPAHGIEQLEEQPGANRLWLGVVQRTGVVRQCVDRQRPEVHAVEHLAETPRRLDHEIGVESTLRPQADRALARVDLRHLAGQCVEIRVLARDDRLLGQIATADSAEIFLRQRRRRREIQRRCEHAPLAEFAHELTAAFDERDGILDPQCAGDDERAVLSEAMASRKARRQLRAAR